MKRKIVYKKPLFTAFLWQVVVLGAVAFFMIAVASYKTPAVKTPATPLKVLGAQTLTADKNENADKTDNGSKPENSVTAVEVKDAPEVKDTPEPTDTPEPSDMLENDKKVENVQKEINQRVQNRETEQVELQSSGEGSGSGKVMLKNKEKTTLELNSPASSTTAVMNLTTASAGEVGVHFTSNGILINNGPYQITTQFPVVINPTDNTLAIKTPSGVTIIKSFPSQALDNLPTGNKFTSVSSITLTQMGQTPVYDVNGAQVRKLLGIIPFNANISQQISAQTGQVVGSQLPWYYSLFGFAFKSI